MVGTCRYSHRIHQSGHSKLLIRAISPALDTIVIDRTGVIITCCHSHRIGQTRGHSPLPIKIRSPAPDTIVIDRTGVIITCCHSHRIHHIHGVWHSLPIQVISPALDTIFIDRTGVVSTCCQSLRFGAQATQIIGRGGVITKSGAPGILPGPNIGVRIGRARQIRGEHIAATCS